jgi:hypothetical protein
MPRLLVLCRSPYHLSPEEAAAWLKQELERVLRADELEGATLTQLANASAQSAREWDWLIELQLERGLPADPASARSACGELLADLRLLGMAPAATVADERDAVELRRP